MTPFNLAAALALGRAVCRDGSVATGLHMDGRDLVGIVNCRDKRWTCDGTWYGAIGHCHGHPIDIVGVPDPSDNPRDSLARGTDPFGGTVIGAGWPQDKKRTLVAVPDAGDQPRAEAVGPSYKAAMEKADEKIRAIGYAEAVDELIRLRAEMARLEQVAIDQRDCIGRLRAGNTALKAERFQAFSDLHARVRELEEGLNAIIEVVSVGTPKFGFSEKEEYTIVKARALLGGGRK